MKIYTKTGDKGTTSLVGGKRIPKNDKRLEAYGTVDELNSWLGFILSCDEGDDETRTFIIKIQNELFDLGCLLATEKESKYQPKQITAKYTVNLEKEIDRLDSFLPKLNKFVLPGGTPAASAANIARTVCRRAERIMSGLEPNTCKNQTMALRYINRLSDYLFVVARYFNQAGGHDEILWEP